MKKRWQPKTLWPRCPECGLLARGPKCLSKDQCTKTMISFEVKSPPKEDKRPPLPEKAEQNQDELWKKVSEEINDEGLWIYEDWDGFKITPKGIAYLKEQFIITRKE